MTGRAILLAAALLLATLGLQALAAPPENADPSLGPWYQSLKQPDTGVGCCSVADCRPVDSRMVGDHYEAMIQGEWVAVPPQKVLDRVPNPTGSAVACWTPWAGILCFVRPTDT